ncbi:MAG TPA: protein translocase subunit SecD [Anaerolineales bacterium]|nr:protein translocase subunit SecD [Anaerolineales bacterium]
MSDRYRRLLIPILILIAAAIWVDLPNNPGIHVAGFNRDLKVVRGLDLQGGLRVLLEADLPAENLVTNEQMQAARNIVENRVNGLGVTEPLVQVAGNRRILVELPGIEDPDQAVATLRQTGLLEFVDFSGMSGSQVISLENQTIQTDFGTQASSTNPTGTPGATGSTVPSTPTSSATETASGTAAATQAAAPTPTASAPVFHTVMTGSDLKTAIASRNQAGEYVVEFTLTEQGTKIFSDFTSAHVGQPLAIVLDKIVISAPVIQNAITQGSGVITGNFTPDEANSLAIQLRYGSLPIPLKVVESKTVGPTLGQDSLRKSTLAGAIGLFIIMTFMVLYYRLPGVIADLALLAYATITFALFKFIPITLTLPGVAGFVLSLGVAVDANVLIFERLREELRGGRTLRQAIDLGFSRAWPSIRDSNLSTLITCGILFWFGSTFGASIVKGFSLTLALGVLVSLFTAITATRSFLHVALDSLRVPEHPSWFGV